MSWQTPKFWYRPIRSRPPLIEWLMIPVSYLYGLGRRTHVAAVKPAKADVPVICVGNLNAGGAGKTPSCMALMNTIRTSGLFEKPCFLTRGYGGDESIILNRAAPTVIHGNRVKGAQEAVQMGADLIVMDDGFQNPSLEKDIQFVVIDGSMGFGNERLIPAGPLREPLEDGFKRADAFILIGGDERGIIRRLPPEKAVFQGLLEPGDNPDIETDIRYFAFAGIGYPDKFFNFLTQKMGLMLVGTQGFADHYPYSIDDMRDLMKRADALRAKLITTEKDILRIPDIARGHITDIKVELHWADEAALVEFLKDRLSL